MIVGGNAKAATFFKSHGISDNLKGEAKYNNKTAELYKQKIIEMAAQYRESKNKKSESTNSQMPQNVQSSSDNKGFISLKDLENSLPIEVSGNHEKKNAVRRRFFEDFDEEEVEEISNIEEKETVTEINNSVVIDEVVEEPIEEKRVVKTSKFMYSDSFDIDDHVQEKNTQKNINYKNEENNEQEYEYTGHSLFDDRPQRKKVLSNNTNKYNKDPKLQSFKDAKSISSRQYFGEEYYNRSDEESRSRLAKFSNAKSISYYDYHGIPRQDESGDIDEIVSRIARTAKEDIKDLGRTLKKTGERIAEWLNELTDD